MKEGTINYRIDHVGLFRNEKTDEPTAIAVGTVLLEICVGDAEGITEDPDFPHSYAKWMVTHSGMEKVDKSEYIRDRRFMCGRRFTTDLEYAN